MPGGVVAGTLPAAVSRFANLQHCSIVYLKVAQAPFSLLSVAEKTRWDLREFVGLHRNCCSNVASVGVLHRFPGRWRHPGKNRLLSTGGMMKIGQRWWDKPSSHAYLWPEVRDDKSLSARRRRRASRGVRGSSGARATGGAVSTDWNAGCLL